MSAAVPGSAPIVGCIRRAAAGANLSIQDMRAAIEAVMDGAATPAQMAALLIALAMKGETAEEIAGAAEAMRARALSVACSRRPLLDVCGTGGDSCGSFNVSTAVAFVVAGAGVAVAKHGNRAMSSRCGSADVLQQLGVRIDAPPELAGALLEQLGIAFLFAQNHHPAMRHVAGVRREIGVRTLFNLLGPLTNPAGATRQVVGVAQPPALRPVASALALLGSERAAVVHGKDGLDEVTLSGPTQVVEWTGTQIIEYELAPEDLKVERRPLSAIAGGDAGENAALVRRVLDGVPGPHRDVVVLNAALTLRIAGITGDFVASRDIATRSIDSGAARAKLVALAEATNA